MATVSVVICSFSLQRWDGLRSTLDELARQTRKADEVIIVADRNDDLLVELRALGVGRAMANAEQPGLSGARNTGWRAATGDVVAFLDDDATPEPEWLERLVAPLEQDGRYVASGGWLRPAGGRVPEWYPEELFWVFGCSWKGLEGRPELRNPIGASMAWRRSTLESLGGFDTSMGRNNEATARPRRHRSHIAGCEDTILGMRANALPGAAIAHAENAVAHHHVGAERVSCAYLLRRSWGEGITKRRVRLLVDQPLSDERRHLARIAGSVARALPHPSRWHTAAFLLASTAAISCGYAYGSLATRREAGPSGPPRTLIPPQPPVPVVTP